MKPLLPDFFNKTSLSNDEVERATLAAVFLDGGEDILKKDYKPVLKPKHFFVSYHKVIYSALLDMLDKNIPVKADGLYKHLEINGMLKKAGGLPVVNDILNQCSLAGDPQRYAEYIINLSIKRDLCRLGNSLVDSGDNLFLEVPKVEADLQSILMDIKISCGQSTRLVKASDCVSDLMETIEKGKAFDGFPTGYLDLDRKIIGLARSDIMVLAGRPGMGKTAFTLNVLRNVTMKGKNRKRALFFSLEMSTQQILMRLISIEAMVDSKRMKSNKDLTPEDWERLIDAGTNITNAGDYIYIDDTPGVSTNDIIASIERLKNMGKQPDVIMVDYLQIMTSAEKAERRDLEIANITRSLKIIAKTYNISVVILSNLNRAVEMRADKRPMLSDLRDSGAIEQDADIVVFMYRDEEYDKKTDKKGIAELIVAKNRSGETGVSNLRFFPEYTRFENLSRAETKYYGEK